MYNKSDCWCCHKCDKHLRNERHGYIIPCDERNECPDYQEHLRTVKALHEKEKLEKSCIAFQDKYTRERNRKRRLDEKRRSNKK